LTAHHFAGRKFIVGFGVGLLEFNNHFASL